MSRRKRIQFRTPSLSAIEDAWQRQATAAAIAAARAVVNGDAIKPMTPVGRLSDTEWGWIVASIIFGWIQERATQATSNGLDTEKTIQKTGLDPDPWDAGAIAAILPELADAPVDWNASLSDLSRDEMIQFLGAAYTLIGKAMLARDLGEKGITRKPPPGALINEDAGIPWDDPIPALDREVNLD
jgi:hypothetical protein